MLGVVWDIALGVVALILCFIFIRFLAISLKIEKKFYHLSFAFSLKVVAGIILTFIYTYYYPNRLLADTYRYFDDSYFLHQLLLENPKDYLLVMLGVKSEVRDTIPLLEQMNNWFPALRSPLYNDNRTVIRINAIMRWFSFGSYYVHLVLFAFMGFIGQMFIYKSFAKYFLNKGTLFFVIVFLIPSVVFWTSGNLKEGPLFLAFGFLLFKLESILRMGWKKMDVLIIGFLFLFLFHMKFYVGLMLLPIFSLYFLFKKRNDVKRWKLILVNYGLYFLIAIVWHFIRFKWSLFTVFKWKKKDFQGLASVMDAKSVIPTYDLEDNPISFLLNIPQGLFNTLFRPLLWEAYTPLIMLNAIENVLILSFMILCFLFRKKEKLSNMTIYFITYSLSLITVVGMVTPILGSLVRYKIPALPFLLLFFLSIVDYSKVQNFVTTLKIKNNEV